MRGFLHKLWFSNIISVNSVNSVSKVIVIIVWNKW